MNNINGFSDFTSNTTPTTIYTADTVPSFTNVIQDQHGASWHVSICNNNHTHTTNNCNVLSQQKSIQQEPQQQREKEEIYRLYELINAKEQKTMKLVSLLNKYS